MLVLTSILFAAQFPLDREMPRGAHATALQIMLRLALHSVLMVGQVVYAIGSALLLSHLYRRGRSQIDQLVGEVRRHGGEAGLAALYACAPAARYLGFNRLNRGWDRLVLGYAFAVALMLAGAVTTLLRG